MACTDLRGKDPNDKQNNGTVGVDASKDYLDAHQLIDSANRRRQQQNRSSTCSAKKPSKPGAPICVQTLKEPQPDPFPSRPLSFTVGKLNRSTLCQTAGLIFSRNRIRGNRQRRPEEPELSERAHQ